MKEYTTCKRGGRHGKRVLGRAKQSSGKVIFGEKRKNFSTLTEESRESINRGEIPVHRGNVGAVGRLAQTDGLPLS